MTERILENKNKLWTKNYILILMFSLSVFIIHYALFTNIPTFIKSIGGNNTVVGLSSTVYIIAALVFRPVFGNLVDNKGCKVVMLIGNSVVFVTTILFYFSKTIAMIMILRAINGIGFCALSIVVGAIVADNVPQSRLSEGISYSTTSLTISTAIAPALGAMLINNFGFKSLFIFVISMSTAGLLFCFFIKYKKPEPKPKETNVNLINTIFEKSAIKPSAIYLILALSYASIASFIFAYGASRGISNISLFFIVYGFSALAVRIGTGKIINIFGIDKIFYIGILALFSSFLLLAFSHTISYIIIAGLLYGMGYGISYPIVNVIIMRVCPENKRGAAMATLFIALDIGIGVGALIWGIVSTYLGYTLVYLSCAAVVLLTALYYFFYIHRNKDYETQ